MDSVVEVGRIRFEVSSVSEVGWLSSVGGVSVEGVPVEGVPVESGVPVDVVGVVTSEVLLPEMEVTIIIRDE